MGESKLAKIIVNDLSTLFLLRKLKIIVPNLTII